MQGSVFALYAELKTSPRSTEHVRQLWCARAQMEHLLFLIDKFDNACMPTTPILHRFVKFTTLPLLKDTTSIGGQTTRYVNAKHVELNDLPGRAYRCFVQPSVKIKYSNLFYDFYHWVGEFFAHWRRAGRTAIGILSWACYGDADSFALIWKETQATTERENGYDYLRFHQSMVGIKQKIWRYRLSSSASLLRHLPIMARRRTRRSLIKAFAWREVEAPAGGSQGSSFKIVRFDD